MAENIDRILSSFGGVENKRLPTEHFGQVVASASFHHFPNQDRGLEKMKRVLKPNGKMIILEIDPDTGRLQEALEYM